MKILLSAKQRGSTNALAPVAQELIRREHDVTIYATGNDSEVAGFGKLSINRANVNEEDCGVLVKGYDTVVVGLSGQSTADGYFLRSAQREGIPSVAVLDQNYHYQDRLGADIKNLPTVIAIMGAECIPKMRLELESTLAEEAIWRSRIVGWTAYDHLGKMKEQFGEDERRSLLERIGTSGYNSLFVYFSQIIHPSADYFKPTNWPAERKEQYFQYELELTRAVLDEAQKLGLSVVVKPHPGEKYEVNFTEKLIRDYKDVKYISAQSCDSKQLMLAADGVIAGRSGCLGEGCLLDRNIGAVLPGLSASEREAFTPVALDAIPYAVSWTEIPGIIKMIARANTDAITHKLLSDKRQTFSVDGKASERVADLIERL